MSRIYIVLACFGFMATALWQPDPQVQIARNIGCLVMAVVAVAFAILETRNPDA